MKKIYPLVLFLLTIFPVVMAVMTTPPFTTHTSNWAMELLQSLTLEEKIGQLFVVAASSSNNPFTESLASTKGMMPYNFDPNYIKALIAQYHIGGILFLGTSTPERQMLLTQEFNAIAKIPLLIAQDCEWGLSMRLNEVPSHVVRYPRNLTLGALSDKTLIYKIAREIGTQCAAIGVHMNLAPVVDTNTNSLNPVIHDRSFGDDPQHVAHCAQLFMQGLHDAGILACAKHFPGHGDTTIDSHYELPFVHHTKERLSVVELYPFKRLINEGISAIMTAHLSVPALDPTINRSASLSYAVVTQELKHHLSFQGLVITDGLGMQAITNHYQPGDLELQAFLAGNDIILCPLDVPGAVSRIKNALTSGLVGLDDLDQRVLKILKAKEWAQAHQKKKSLDVQQVYDYITRPEAYALQRTAYRQAITIAYNTANIEWNKETLSRSCVIQIGHLPEHIVEHKARPYCATFVHYDESTEKLDACIQKSRDHALVLVSIGSIDKRAQQFGISNATRMLIKELKNDGATVIVILFGTPYASRYFLNADALIVAYEDIAIAQEAVCDVLMGSYRPQGTLPIKLES